MTNSYHPFFNRKYLTGLIWFCLLAILVLTSMGPDEPEPGELHYAADQGIYWLEQADQPLQLSLIFPTAPALHPQHQLLQQLLQTIVQQRLKAFADPGYSYQVSRTQDSLVLSFSWLSDQPQPALQQILDALSEPVDPIRWLPALEKLKAAAYLDNQAVDTQLLNRFMARLDETSGAPLIERLVPAYAGLLQNPIITLAGDNAEQAIQQLPVKTSNVQHQIQNKVRPLTAIHQTGESRDSRFHLLLGMGTDGRASDRYPIQRLTTRVVEDLLVQYHQQAPELEYRLLFSALKQQGYRALLLHSDRHPAQILQALQQEVTEKQVAHSRDQLLEQWQQQLAEPSVQRQWLNLIARYQLPLETLQDYPKQLQALEPEQVVTEVRQALQSQTQFSILLPPN